MSPKFLSIALLWTWVAGLSGCALPPTHPEYAIYFDGDGFPIAATSSIRRDCADGNHEPAAPPGWSVISDECFTKEYVPRILDGMEHSGKRKVLLFAHGGLVTLQGATQRVDRLTSVGDGPLTLREDYYPIFINWQASLVSSYKDHLFRIRQGQRQPWVAKLTSPYIVAKDLVFGAVRTVPDTVELAYDSPERTRRKVGCSVPPEPEYQLIRDPECKEGEPEVDVQWGRDVRGGGTRAKQVLLDLPWLPIKPFSTGLVIDGFGSESWKIMIRRTEQMFHRESAKLAGDGPEDHRSLTYFLQQLRDRVLSQATRITQVDFVAHSAGAIILNRALREVPDLPLRHIVYMAAASSEEDYEMTMLGDGRTSGYLHFHPCAQVYHLVLHPTAETHESYLDPFYAAPDGSLLYWIDSFLAEPVYLRGRTAGRVRNLAPRLDDTPLTLRTRVHLKVFDYGVPLHPPPSGGPSQDLLDWYVWCDGHRDACQPQRHGDFSEMPFWKEWFWTPNTARARESGLCRE